MLLPACVLHLCCFQCVIVELVKPGQSRREPLMSGERQVYVCVCVCVCVSHSVMSESLQPHRL